MKIRIEVLFQMINRLPNPQKVAAPILRVAVPCEMPALPFSPAVEVRPIETVIFYKVQHACGAERWFEWALEIPNG